MSKDVRLRKLEDIEHAYFCLAEDCPVCGGVNFYLQKAYASDRAQETGVGDSAAENEIWRLQSDSPYPLYVLIVRDDGALKKCVRVSDFTDFKADGDLLADEYLIECWNSFYVKSDKFAVRIGELDQKTMRKIGEAMRTAGETGAVDTAVSFFRDLEVQYQEHVL